MKRALQLILVAQTALWPVAGYSHQGVVSFKTLSATPDHVTVAEVLPGMNLEQITASLRFQERLADSEFRNAVRALSTRGADVTFGEVRDVARRRHQKTADLVIGVACGAIVLGACALIWACAKGKCGGGGGGGMDINDPANPASPLSPANPANPASPLNPLNM